MFWKLLLQILTAIFGIMAVVCALLPTPNRIVLVLAFALAAAIFGFLIPFLRVGIPEIDCYITSSSLNYAEGLLIDGVIWEKDFREYFLWVRNKSKQVEAHDLKIDMDMIGSIVKYEISSQQGCEGIFFSRNTTDRFGKAEKGVITETTKLYSNNLQIGTEKLSFGGHYKVRLVVKAFPVDEDSGTFIIKYRYLNVGGEKINQSFVYKILKKDKVNKSLYIDTTHPIIGYFDRKVILTFGETVKIEENKLDSAGTYNNLGVTYAQAGEKAKAIEEFKLAIKDKPDLASAHNNLGAQLEEIDKAIEEFKLAIKYEPDFAEAHNNLGIAYAKIGKTNKAIEEYELAIKFKVDYEWAYYNLGVTYTQEGETGKAIDEFKLALKYKPDFAWAHYNLGVIYKKQGEADKAIEEYKLAIRCEPDFADAYNSLGVIYAQTGETDKAIEEFKLAIKYNPGYVKAHNNLRIAYKNRGIQY
ncbi:MAG: tetratricopeptide repeat protein [Candidatus Omnitrophica bacterium]|nr:tetratricopeptide repeat protein [Candidatus Omnitrophota bacterium]